MANRASGDINTNELLRDFRLYDQAVDVVSAHHWFFTNVSEVVDSVEHFERYPSIRTAGRVMTPDFTVLFKDGRAIAAEIAQLSRHDNSVESLCRQVGRYSGLQVVPGSSNGRLASASVVDIALFIPMEIGDDAARRIFVERLDNPEHGFSMARRPVLIQFAFTNDKYVFQKWPDSSLNGELAAGPYPGYEALPSFKIRPDLFLESKVRFGLMNDPVKPLYLAARLWMNVFPDRFWVDDSKNVFTASLRDIGQAVRAHYGRGKNGEVESAMNVLVAAGLARVDGDRYTVPRHTIRGELADAIVERIIRGRASGRERRAKLRVAIPGQGTLFDEAR